MRVYAGQGVSQGVCVGPAMVWRTEDRAHSGSSHPPRACESREQEWARFIAARERVKQELLDLYEKSRAQIGEESAAILEIQAMMADDEEFAAMVHRGIWEREWSAPRAIEAAQKEMAARLAAMQDAYLRERAQDVRQIAQRMIHISEHGDRAKGMPPLTQPCVLCADDLTPAATAGLDRALVLGFVTAKGSATSHTAILAKAMALPAIVGVGEEAIASLREGCRVALDAQAGTLYIEPDEDTLSAIEEIGKRHEQQRRVQERYRGKPTRTASGRQIHLYANAALPEDVATALAADAEGIGLFRSEFLYLGRSTPPDEEEQYRIYREILTQMDGRRVIVRTLDIGADKQAACLPMPGKEENPALGCRAVRYSLRHPSLFLTQARALLRAASAAHGQLSVMFPLISSEDELRGILSLWHRAASEVNSAAEVELGIMIETPAAALISDRLARMVDFFSIGTNDLSQYTLAMDRQNEALSPFYQPHHPAILSLIRTTVKNAKAAGIWVGICGELGADGDLTEEFLRMGVDELSVAPSQILALRERIAQIP